MLCVNFEEILKISCNLLLLQLSIEWLSHFVRLIGLVELRRPHRQLLVGSLRQSCQHHTAFLHLIYQRLSAGLIETSFTLLAEFQYFFKQMTCSHFYLQVFQLVGCLYRFFLWFFELTLHDEKLMLFGLRCHDGLLMFFGLRHLHLDRHIFELNNLLLDHLHISELTCRFG